MSAQDSLCEHLPVVHIIPKKEGEDNIIKRFAESVDNLQWVTHTVQLRSSIAKVTFFYRRDDPGVDYLLFHRRYKDYLVNTQGMRALYYDVKNFFSAIGEKGLSQWWLAYKPKRHTLKGRFLGHSIEDLCVHSTIKLITFLPYDLFDFLQNKRYVKSLVCIPFYVPVSTLSRFNSTAIPFSSVMAYTYLNRHPLPMSAQALKRGSHLTVDLHILSQKRGILTMGIQRRG